MKRLLYLVLFIGCLFPSVVFSDSTDSLLVNAYTLTAKGDLKTAGESFEKAYYSSIKEGNERGLIESLRGIYLVDSKKKAVNYAFSALDKTNSWRAVCGIGYLLASSGENNSKIKEVFYKAYKLASNNGDWYGMAEAGKGLYLTGNKKEGLGCLETAERVAKLQHAYDRMDILAGIYERIGEKSMARNLRKEIISLQKNPRPKLIDTLPGEKKISKESSEQISEMAKRDMDADDEYIIAEKMKENEKRYYHQWLIVSPYLGYVYEDVSLGLVDNYDLDDANLTNWAQTYLNYYSLGSDGVYIYVGRND